MKAAEFDYLRPSNLGAALDLLANESADVQILAGGQSLMPMMNFRLAQPELLVDLNGLEELQFIRQTDSHIQIGSMTRYCELETSSLIQQHVPLLSIALPHIAHSAIRNRGTIGGSTALADPAAEMPALLIALNATIVTRSREGQRSTEASKFFLGLYETALDSGELIESISIPKSTTGSACGFYELARRHGDYAMAGVAVTAQRTDPINDARVVFFAISDRAIRAETVENHLNGLSELTEEGLENARKEIDKLDFHGDLNAEVSTKRHLAKVVFKRAIEEMMR
ncbi:MAG: xanthine dehydrogenase family protein subunit M [Rhizobiaceae bacterium]|nr:xanthine dehydrogenase family protein subunit M [Rhizobiaceae bacterium]